MPRERKANSPALRHTYDRYIGDDPKRRNSLEEQRANLDIALKVHQLRVQAGLTHRKLAKLVGTTPTVISQLEDADYEGHSLAMLRRIADALNQRVEIRFRPMKGKRVAV